MDGSSVPDRPASRRLDILQHIDDGISFDQAWKSNRGLFDGEVRTVVYPKMTSSKINSQVEESRTFSTSKKLRAAAR